MLLHVFTIFRCHYTSAFLDSLLRPPAGGHWVSDISKPSHETTASCPRDWRLFVWSGPATICFATVSSWLRLQNDLHCVGWGAKLYSLSPYILACNDNDDGDGDEDSINNKDTAGTMYMALSGSRVGPWTGKVGDWHHRRLARPPTSSYQWLCERGTWFQNAFTVS